MPTSETYLHYSTFLKDLFLFDVYKPEVWIIFFIKSPMAFLYAPGSVCQPNFSNYLFSP